MVVELRKKIEKALEHRNRTASSAGKQLSLPGVPSDVVEAPGCDFG